MEKLKNCIICDSTKHSAYLDCLDYLVTKQEFSIVICDNCGFVFTNPRPTKDEIGPYYKSEDYFSHSDDNKSIMSSIYNFVRNINIKGKLSLVLKAVGGKGELLDYGCGAGLFIKSASKEGWQTRGVEPNADARKVAIKHCMSVDTPQSLSSVADDTFDVITLWHVLEHLHDIESVIPKLKLLLKGNGVLVVAIPNIYSWDAKKYKEKWAAYDVPRHLFHFSPKTVELFFTKFGMKIVNSYPMKFDSFYVSLLSEKKSIFAYPFALVNGIVSNLKGRFTGNYSSTIYIIK